jgi:hypothetical protein
MFGKKQPDNSQMTPAERDELHVYVVGGAADGPAYWLARQRLECVRWAVDHGRMSETPTEQMVAPAAAPTGPSPRRTE